jgi:DNA-binding MarR family transcriptional regulator
MSTDALEQLQASLQRLGRLLGSRQIASRLASAAGADVSQQGAVLLRVLLRDGRQAVATLASSAAMDLGAVSRQVRLLEEAGAVRRAKDPDDGRVALLELTPRGRRMAEAMRAVGVRHLEAALADWSDADRLALATQLQRLVGDLRSTPVPERGAPQE